MKILFAGLASPGFIAPLIGAARALRAHGHEIACATDRSLERLLHYAGVRRIPRGSADGASFTVPNWFDVDAASMQVLHLEYALRIFRPDALVTSQNCLGAAVIAAKHSLPLIVIGSVVLLFPTVTELRASVRTAHDERRRDRLESMIRYLNPVRARFGLPPVAPDDAGALLGDRYLVQGIPELQRERDFAATCGFAGGDLLRDVPRPLAEDDAEWIDRQRARRRCILYVSVGRVFHHVSYASILLEWARARDVAVILDAARCEAPPDERSEIVRRCDGLNHNDLLPHVDGVVCGGHPTAVIGAINYRRPLAICHTGSGTDDIGEACGAFGLAASVAADSAPREAFFAAFDRVLDDPMLRARSVAAADAFARIDSAARVVDAVGALSMRQARSA
ncbi:MAG TPA: hypothetical protein VGX96_04180 [Candidatus Elarobacter sp.]|jgi:UDP:flavonoid glycosyltransferase YjiC (YdhE family)|nr:hypothetical protein [Candidatus Elarobacter sp.]